MLQLSKIQKHLKGYVHMELEMGTVRAMQSPKKLHTQEDLDRSGMTRTYKWLMYGSRHTMITKKSREKDKSFMEKKTTEGICSIDSSDISDFQLRCLSLDRPYLKAHENTGRISADAVRELLMRMGVNPSQKKMST